LPSAATGSSLSAQCGRRKLASPTRQIDLAGRTFSGLAGQSYHPIAAALSEQIAGAGDELIPTSSRRSETFPT
jgi:hypothetical protein